MTAYLYLADEGYMAFEADHAFFKFLVPKRLTTVNAVKTYDDGYVVIDTNYGEEYIDLKAIADEVAISFDFSDIRLELKEA